MPANQQNGSTPAPPGTRPQQRVDPSKCAPGADCGGGQRPNPSVPGKPNATTGGTAPPGKPADGQQTDIAGKPRVTVAVNADQSGTKPGVRVAVDSSGKLGGCQAGSPCSGTDGAHRPGLPGVSDSQSGTLAVAGKKPGHTDEPTGVHVRVPLLGGKSGASTDTTGTSDGRGKPPGQCGAGGDCTHNSGQQPAVPPGPSNVNGGQNGSAITGGAGSGPAVHTGQKSTGDTEHVQLAAGHPQQGPQTAQRSAISERGPPPSDGHTNTQETRVQAMADTHAQGTTQTTANGTISARTVAARTTTVSDKPAQRDGQQQTNPQQQTKSNTLPGLAPLGTPKAVEAVDRQPQADKNNKDSTPAPHLMFPGGKQGGSSQSGGNTGTALDSVGERGTQKSCTDCHGQGQPAPVAPAPGSPGPGSPGPGSNGPSNMGGGQNGNGHGGAGGQLATEHGTTATVQPGTRPGADDVQLAAHKLGQSPTSTRGPPARTQPNQQINAGKPIPGATLGLDGLRSPGGSPHGVRGPLGAAPVTRPVPNGSSPTPPPAAPVVPPPGAPKPVAQPPAGKPQPSVAPPKPQAPEVRLVSQQTDTGKTADKPNG
ncbi:MAG: hypothetical protein J2P32_13865, partial [Actinobacteria bacterium]|nr:hypothetical protein [Actinomycetota bacterium]